ncbi:MAG: hypothetical protein SOW66_01915, partial [Porphyromonas sp.]|nr:hypothetical protein [Porphyromonas sp.]
KLSAIEAALQAQTLGLGEKLTLLQKAVENQTLKQGEAATKLATAIDEMKISLQEKLTKIEIAINGAATTQAEKLTAIEAAIQAHSLSLDKKLDLIANAINGQSVKLETVLERIAVATNDLKASLEKEITDLVQRLHLAAQDENARLVAIEEAMQALREEIKKGSGSLEVIVGLLERVLEKMHEQEKPALVTMMTTKTQGETIELKFAPEDSPVIAGAEEMHDLPIALASSTSGPKKDGWVTRKYRLTSSNGRVRIDGKVTLLNCGGNGLTSLEVGNNAELKHLLCHNNSIQTLNLSANSNLEILDCNSNRLTRLDLSKNSNLEVLVCHNNQLAELSIPTREKARGEGQINFKQQENERNSLTKDKVKEISGKHWNIQMYSDNNWVPYQGDDVLS